MKAIIFIVALLYCNTIASQTWDHPLFTMRIAENMRSPGGDGGKGIDESVSRMVGSYVHHSSARFSPDTHPARVGIGLKSYLPQEEGKKAVMNSFIEGHLRRESTSRAVDTFKTDNGLVVVELFHVWSGVSLGTPFSHEVTSWYIQGENRVYHFDMCSEFDDRFYQSRLEEFRGYIRTFKEK